MQGQVATRLTEGQRALARMEATKNHSGITQCRTFLLPVYFERADMSRLLEESEQTVGVAVKSDMAVHASLRLCFKTLAQSRLAHALTKSQPARWDQAKVHLTERLRFFEGADVCLEAARTRVAGRKILCERGEVSSARANFQQAAAQFGKSRLTRELQETRTLMLEVELAR